MAEPRPIDLSFAPRAASPTSTPPCPPHPEGTRHPPRYPPGSRVPGPPTASPANGEARITLLLAMAPALIRQGFMALLREVASFHLVGETGDGLETVALVARLRP